MKAEPLSKEIYNKAKGLGVQKITLSFSGGNDEGFLTVAIEPSNRQTAELESEVESWAWSVYSYSGAGEGHDYGDDIAYDLVNNKVLISDWAMQPVESEVQESSLPIEE